jgi:hypothetical protein
MAHNTQTVVRLYVGAALVFIALVVLWLVQTRVVWGWDTGGYGSWWITILLAVLIAGWAGFRWWRRR